MRTIILGPPGTGKTTSMLHMVNSYIERGVTPEQICFITFTRRATKEAKDRAMAKFNLREEQLPWFRTLHSMAFQQVGMSRQNIMGIGDFIKIAEMVGVRITLNKNINEDGTFSQSTEGDRLFFAEAMSRTKMMTLRDYFDMVPNEDLYWYKLELLANTIKRYKEENGKLDFTDIVVKFIECPMVPDCKVLLVDEAQDLSPLQWMMVDKLSEKIEDVFVAGDDDQAIFRWAGADVEHLIGLTGDQQVLGQSYRVPRAVQEVAHEVVTKIQNRIPKEWRARDAEGVVERVNGIAGVDMSEGTWLLLVRNVYLMDNFIHHCMREGLIFDAPNSPLKSDTFEAIRGWERLRKGEHVPASTCKKIYDLMSVRERVTHGFKGTMQNLVDTRMLTIAELKEKFGLISDQPWEIAMDKINIQEREYFLAAGASLQQGVRIRISTIHGAKGAEADNVVLCTDMAMRTYREYEANPDDEHRCWYVAVTRAKQRLIIMNPETTNCYDL